MELWQTKQKHKIGKKREFHRVKMLIPTNNMEWILEGICRLQENHGVPRSANITIKHGWNVWIEAYWMKEV